MGQNSRNSRLTSVGHERIVIVVRGSKAPDLKTEYPTDEVKDFAIPMPKGHEKIYPPYGRGKVVTMATKNNGITRADAIAFAMERCTDNADVVAVLKKMHDQLTKPRAKAVSKARLANEGLAKKLRAAVVAKGDGMSTKDFVALGMPEITTTQKAAAVARVACEMGLLTKCVNGKAITYALA